MAEEVIDKNIELISKSLETDNLIIGTERVMKLLKNGELGKIFATKNAPDDVVGDLTYYANIAKCELISLTVNNEELGTICRKPFAISVVGLKK